MRGFTLVEILVAIGVLVTVVLASSKIFEVASEINRKAKTAGLQQTMLVTIENQIREDISGIDANSFLGIRSVAVPNNIYADSSIDTSDIHPDVLLIPSLSEESFVRCDQIVFLQNRFDTPKSRVGYTGSGDYTRIVAPASMIHYGHGMQFKQFPPVVDIANPTAGTEPRAADPVWNQTDSVFGLRDVPWYRGDYQYVEHDYIYPENYFQQEAGGTVDGTQPNSSEWILARNAVLLSDDDPRAADDGVYKTLINGNVGNSEGTRTSMSLFDANLSTQNKIDIRGIDVLESEHRFLWRHGRVDIASTDRGEVLEFINKGKSDLDGDGVFSNIRPFRDQGFEALDGTPDQFNIIQSLLKWSRAESTMPSMHRCDEALGKNVIGSSIVHFQIEWSWDENIGLASTPINEFWNESMVLDSDQITYFGDNNYYNQTTDILDYRHPGILYADDLSLPWFGSFDSPENFDGSFDPADVFFTYQNFENAYPSHYPVPPSLLDSLTRESQITASSDLIRSERFESLINSGQGELRGVSEYRVVFGSNSGEPYHDQWLNLNYGGDEDDTRSRTDFTPWPSALKFTIMIQDRTKLESPPLEHSFIVRLPTRTK